MFVSAGSRGGRNRRRWGTNTITDQNANQPYADMSFGNQRPSRLTRDYNYNDQSFDFFVAPGGSSAGSMMFPSNGGYRMVLSGIGGTNNTLGVSLVGPNSVRGLPFPVNRGPYLMCSLGQYIDAVNGFSISGDTFLQRDAAQVWSMKSSSPYTLRIYGDATANYSRLSLTQAAAGGATIATEQSGTGAAGSISVNAGNNGAAGAVFGTSSITFNQNVNINASQAGGGGNATLTFGFNGRLVYSGGATPKTWAFDNSDGATAFFALGGSGSASRPALKVNSSSLLAFRLSDDSGDAPISCDTVQTKGYTVATLPAAGTAGRRAHVTDATAPTFLGTLTGGGSVKCPVFDNGTAWVAG